MTLPQILAGLGLLATAIIAGSIIFASTLRCRTCGKWHDCHEDDLRCQDAARYRELQATMKRIGNPDSALFQAAWAESERIKNHWQGFPP